jgi:hypothetical protein
MYFSFGEGAGDNQQHAFPILTDTVSDMDFDVSGIDDHVGDFG